MKVIRKNVVFLTIICSFFVMNGSGAFAQSVEDNVTVSDDSIPSLEMQGEEGGFIDRVSGPIEMIGQGEIRLMGVDYDLNEEVICSDMDDNLLEPGSLKEGDEVDLYFHFTDKSVVSIRLSGMGNGDDAIVPLDEPARNKVNSREIRRKKDGTYTN